MTIKEIARQAAAKAFADAEDGWTCPSVADAVAVAVLREVERRLQGKLFGPPERFLIASMLAEFTPAPDLKEWVSKPGQIKTSDSNREVLDELAKLPLPAPVTPEPEYVECGAVEYLDGRVRVACSRPRGHLGAHGSRASMPVTPEPPPLLECDQCGLKQSEWGLPLVADTICPRHYLDDDSCDGVIRAVTPLPASEARPTTEDARTICLCGTVMVCPDIGCDRNKVPSPSPPPEVEPLKAATSRLWAAVDAWSEADTSNRWPEREACVDALDAYAAAIRAESHDPKKRCTRCGLEARRYYEQKLEELGNAQAALAAQAQEIERLKAEWEKASDKYHAEAELQIEWQARAEAAEAKLSQIPLLEDQSILDYRRDGSSYNEGRMDMMAQIRASLLPPPDKGTL